MASWAVSAEKVSPHTGKNGYFQRRKDGSDRVSWDFSLIYNVFIFNKMDSGGTCIVEINSKKPSPAPLVPLPL